MKKNPLVVLAVLVMVSLVSVGCAAPAPVSAPAPSSVPAPAKSSAPAPAPAPAPKPTAAPAPAPVKPIKITFTTQSPATSWLVTQAAIPWFKQVEEATKGRVTFEPYYGASIVKADAFWEALQSGIVDGAYCVMTSWQNMIPLSTVISLPFLPFETSEQASSIMVKLYEEFPEIRNEYKANHVLIIFAGAGPPTDFVITTKKEIKTWNDFKGLKIRMPPGPQTDLMKAVGATPIAMNMADTYMGLEKGVIDGMGGNWDTMQSFRLYELVKYYTFIPRGGSPFTIALNREKWNSLPADIKTQVESVSGLKGAKFWGKTQFDIAGTVASEKIKSQGYKMIEYHFTREQLEEGFNLYGKPIWDAWVKNMEAGGHNQARAVLNRVNELIKTYRP